MDTFDYTYGGMNNQKDLGFGLDQFGTPYTSEADKIRGENLRNVQMQAPSWQGQADNSFNPTRQELIDARYMGYMSPAYQALLKKAGNQQNLNMWINKYFGSGGSINDTPSQMAMDYVKNYSQQNTVNDFTKSYGQNWGSGNRNGGPPPPAPVIPPEPQNNNFGRGSNINPMPLTPPDNTRGSFVPPGPMPLTPPDTNQFTRPSPFFQPPIDALGNPVGTNGHRTIQTTPQNNSYHYGGNSGREYRLNPLTFNRNRTYG